MDHHHHHHDHGHHFDHHNHGHHFDHHNHHHNHHFDHHHNHHFGHHHHHVYDHHHSDGSAFVGVGMGVGVGPVVRGPPVVRTSGPVAVSQLQRSLVIKRVSIPSFVQGSVVWYTVQVSSNNNSWAVNRRYSQFDTLRMAVQQRVSECSHMAHRFPPKTFFACSAAQLPVRQTQLESWLRELLEMAAVHAGLVNNLHTFLEVSTHYQALPDAPAVATPLMPGGAGGGAEFGVPAKEQPYSSQAYAPPQPSAPQPEAPPQPFAPQPFPFMGGQQERQEQAGGFAPDANAGRPTSASGAFVI